MLGRVYCVRMARGPQQVHAGESPWPWNQLFDDVVGVMHFVAKVEGYSFSLSQLLLYI